MSIAEAEFVAASFSSNVEKLVLTEDTIRVEAEKTVENYVLSFCVKTLIVASGSRVGA